MFTQSMNMINANMRSAITTMIVLAISTPNIVISVNASIRRTATAILKGYFEFGFEGNLFGDFMFILQNLIWNRKCVNHLSQTKCACYSIERLWIYDVI